MNRNKILVAVALALGASAAFAQEASSDRWMDIDTNQVRDQVQADLAQARADGTIHAWRDGYLAPMVSTKSRSEVVSATLAARDSGELAAINAEVYRFTREPAVRLAAAGH